MTKRINLKISVSGVRGIVGEFLTPELAIGFAAAFGQWTGGGRVVVGRDTRNSGLMLEHAVVCGLLSAGCQPVLLGIVPTPTVLMTVSEMNANGGIVITASHNPAEWNALKFIGPRAVFLNEQEATELQDVYNQPEQSYIREKEYRNIRVIDHAFVSHAARISGKIDVDSVRSARIRVAVDCCNGVGAWYSQEFLESLGCEVIPIYDERDGLFRRPPEPSPVNLEALGRTVREKQCDLGFAQDPDGDRIAILDGDGNALGEQYSLALTVAHVLAKRKGPVVVNIQTTKAVADIAGKAGCPMHYSKVGEIHVVDRMLETGAVIGGEGGSGGVIWPDIHPCRDSFAAMALVLEMMAQRGKTIRQLVDELPRYHTKNLRISCSPDRSLCLIRELCRRYSDENPTVLDGFRLDRDDSWVLVRASNTEPILRINAEGNTEDAAERIAAEFASRING